MLGVAAAATQMGKSDLPGFHRRHEISERVRVYAPVQKPFR